MLPSFATVNASATAFGGRGVVVSMWHTSAAGTCATIIAKSIGNEGEKRFTARSRDFGLGPARMTDG